MRRAAMLPHGLNKITEEKMTTPKFARMTLTVMPGLVPGIHALLRDKEGVDGRNKSGHDER
jgi:hypothetical protein